MLQKGICPHTKGKLSKPSFGVGVYNIYKPKGPTSYDIIRELKKQTEEKRIGHGGTLDPLASGVLIVAIGSEFTKQLDEIAHTDKEYLATIKLGQTSSTGDEEGEKTDIKYEKEPSENEIKTVLNLFVGKIKQTPPAYSAVKISGIPSYKLARQGKKVPLKERTVSIYETKFLEYNWPILKIDVKCSSGTYIRSLAEDIGKSLKTGAYLSDLVRLRVANFKIKDAIKL